MATKKTKHFGKKIKVFLEVLPTPVIPVKFQDDTTIILDFGFLE